MLVPEEKAEIIRLSRQFRVCCVVPFFNNRQHVTQVLKQLLALGFPVIAVSDGSTDGSADEVQPLNLCAFLKYSPNRGKGYALRLAFQKSLELGYAYAITVDADGQHLPSEALALLKALEAHPGALVVGARRMEGKEQSKAAGFANRFSNFWFGVHALQRLSDTQSGFRLYPLKAVTGLRLMGRRYEFEVEVLVKAAWRGIKIVETPVDVCYPPRSERVSFFKPGWDFFRISLMNTYLTLGALLYGHWVIVARRLSWKSLTSFLRHHVFSREEPVWKKAASIGLGVCMGIVPVWGWQMLSAGILAHLLKLNKGLAVISSNISMPPMLPFIIWGSVETGALFFPPEWRFKPRWEYLQADPWQALGAGGMQYVLGAVALGILAGLAAFVISLPLLHLARQKNWKKKVTHSA